MALPVKPKKSLPVSEGESEDMQWEDFSSTSPAYLPRPGDEVMFKPLESPRRIKEGNATVVNAYVYYFKQGGVNILQNQNAVIMLQKIPSDALERAISTYGLDFVMKIKNLGRQQGKRFYQYDIKVARVSK